MSEHLFLRTPLDGCFCILQFACDEIDEEESDMKELYGDEDILDENSIDEITIDRNSISDAFSDEEILEAPTKRRKHGEKQLTYTRTIHSIDSASCEQNYDILSIPTKKKIVKGELLANSTSTKKKFKKDILFSNLQQKTICRQNEKTSACEGFRCYCYLRIDWLHVLHGLNKHSINLLFSDKKGLPVFGGNNVLEIFKPEMNG